MDLGLIILPEINLIANEESWERKYQLQFPKLIREELGCLVGKEIELNIDETVKPVRQKQRRVPFLLCEAVELELLRLVREGILERVSGPTTWVSNLVIVPKEDGSVRLCSDARAANKAIKRIRHMGLTIDDIIYRLNGSKWFAKIDLRKAYLQLVLNKASRNLTTITTHIGLFRYTWLCFGICSAAEIFAEEIRLLIEDVEGALNIADDILLHAETREKLKEILLDVLMRLEHAGLTANASKCQFFVEKIIFFGMEFSGDGVAITLEKQRALREASAPINLSELNSLLGLALFCNRSIKDFSSITAPLWDLTKKQVRWAWTNECEVALKKLKDAIVGDAMAYFNKLWETKLVVDAGPAGLGAVLTQYNPINHEQTKVVAFASRRLSDVETIYSQVEREALAFIWGMERFHLYVFGKSFVVGTDNKAVELIMRNPNSDPPARIKRWALRASQYD